MSRMREQIAAELVRFNQAIDSGFIANLERLNERLEPNSMPGMDLLVTLEKLNRLAKKLEG